VRDAASIEYFILGIVPSQLIRRLSLQQLSRVLLVSNFLSLMGDGRDHSPHCIACRSRTSPSRELACVMLARRFVGAILTTLLLAGCAFGLPPNEATDAATGTETPPPRGPAAADAAAATTSVPFDFHECTEIHCPPSAPFVVGCADIVMTGNAQLGCVATIDPSTVAFEQGNLCRSDDVSGRVICSATAGAPLGPDNCPLSQPRALYLSSLSNCDY
jgi:hypothetical protein